MRADRLVAVLLLMQNRGRVTAADLARELEVSVATARRDLEALSAAGVPVYPQPGRGGGWSLVGGARTDLSGLSATEARALFLLLGPATTDSGAARSALRKLVRALRRRSGPTLRRRRARRWSTRPVGATASGTGRRWSTACRTPWWPAAGSG
ncbi:helix-turn-helix transcriptional regulator [Luedemannella flava]